MPAGRSAVNETAVSQAALLWDCRCRLGEGAVWNQADASIYFVDIKGREVLAFTPSNGLERRWAVPQMVGWLVPRQSGGWLAGFQTGIVSLELGADGLSRFEPLHLLHDAASPLRLNDAKADARGRLWFGSMNATDETLPHGVFYRLDAASMPEPVDHGYAVTNGPTFSVDGRTLYHTDSVARTIYAFDVDDAAEGGGALSNKRVWLRFDETEGWPDGMTTDAEGCIWVAHWRGARVTRRDEKGREIGRIDVAAPQVTNVAFGGDGFRDLYITTARTGLDAAALVAAPHAGGLFVAGGAGRGMAPGSFAS